MPVKKSIMKVLLSTALMTTSFVGVVPTLVHAASSQASVGGVDPASGGATSGTAAGQFQTSDSVAVLQVGFIANPDGVLSADASSDALQDPFKFSHDLERTMLYISPNKVSDSLFRKEGSGLIGYSSAEGVLSLYGNNPLYPESSSHYSHDDLMKKTLAYADEAKNSQNYFEQVMGKALVAIDPDNPNRTLSGTSGQPVGSALKNILEKYIVKQGNPDIDSKINQSLILKGYLDLIKERGILTGDDYTNFEKQLQDAFRANELVLLFQTTTGFSVKDSNSPLSRDYAFIPMHDGVNWYLDIQQAAKPDNETVQNLSANREAEAVTYGGASTSAMGNYSPYLENGNLPFSFRTYARDNYTKTLKPVTSEVALSSDVGVNAFGAWGFQPWEYGGIKADKRPEIDAQLNVTVLDNSGNKVDTFTEPVAGWSEDTKKALAEIASSTEDARVIKGGLSITHNGKTYEILPDDNARFTLVDKKDNENLNKSTMTKAAIGKDGAIAIPGSDNDFEVYLGYDTPSPNDLNAYLGGDTQNSSSVENKYAGTDESSNAELTLFVKAQEVIPGQPISNTFEVSQWRLSRYWGNISPRGTNKSRFSLSLPIQTFYNPRLYPSGNQTFSLVNPDLSNTPWAESSKAKLVNDTPNKNISVFSTSASFSESGDLLAVKDNGSVLTTKLADWVNNFSLFNGKIGSTSKGNVDDKSVVTKSSGFSYGVKAPSPTYTYSETRWGVSCGKLGCWSYPYTWSGQASSSYLTADYNVKVNFKHYTPKDSVAPKKFDPASESANGLYWQTKQINESILVDPEVLYAYDDASGKTSVAFAAGEKLRPIQPVAYNQAKYINLQVDPVVTGMSTATDPAARALASRLNSNKDVILKGSATTNSFNVTGDLEIKTFALDIGSSALKNSWNPTTTYNTDAINDDYLKEYATKDANTGKWQVSFNAEGKFVVNGKDFGGQTDKLTVDQKSTTVTEHQLEVRGGKVVGVDGSRDLIAIPQELKDALTRMHILGSDNVFNTFESGNGDKLTEDVVADLGNAVRGTNDLAVGKGFYNEDSTILVVREYTTTFALPSYQYADKLPMELTPDLAVPGNKANFYSVGVPGFTKLHLKVGNVEMIADSSKGQIGVKQVPQFIVSNVSVLDSFGSAQ